MRSIHRCLIPVVFALLGTGLEGQAPAAGLQVRRAELEKQPIPIPQGTLTLQKLRGSGISLRVDNRTTEPFIFSPWDITLVGPDGFANQIRMGYYGSHGPASFQVTLPPATHVEESYVLANATRFPVKVYFKGVLVAEIQE